MYVSKGAPLHVTDNVDNDDPTSSFMMVSRTQKDTTGNPPSGARVFGPPSAASVMASPHYVYLPDGDEGEYDGPALEVLDKTLLDPQEGPVDDVQVRVIRVMFAATAVQMAFVTIISLVIWAYGTSVGEYNKGAAVGVMAAILTITLVVLNIFKSSKIALVPMCLFLIELSLVCGFTAVALSALAPIQLMVTLFAQSISILGYTAVSTRYIDLRKSTLLLIVVTIVCWLVGIFAFIEDEDWISAVIVLILAWLVSIYYVLQIKYSNRYHLNNKIESISNMYTDPVDVLWTQIKILVRKFREGSREPVVDDMSSYPESL